MTEGTLAEDALVVATLAAGISGVAIMAVVITTRLPLMAITLVGGGHITVVITATARVIMVDGSMATIMPAYCEVRGFSNCMNIPPSDILLMIPSISLYSSSE